MKTEIEQVGRAFAEAVFAKNQDGYIPEGCCRAETIDDACGMTGARHAMATDAAIAERLGLTAKDHEDYRSSERLTVAHNAARARWIELIGANS